MIPPRRMPDTPDEAAMEQMRKEAIQPNDHTAILTDFPNGQVLVVGMRTLDINRTVIALPLSLFVGVAGLIMQGVAAPMLGQAEAANRATKPTGKPMQVE